MVTGGKSEQPFRRSRESEVFLLKSFKGRSN